MWRGGGGSGGGGGSSGGGGGAAAVLAVLVAAERNERTRQRRLYIIPPMNNPFQQQFSDSMPQGGLLGVAIHIPTPVPVLPAARMAKLVDWHTIQVDVVERTYANFR